MVRAVTHDLTYLRVGFVNVFFFGRPGSRGWVLIDAGLPRSAGWIERGAAVRFGAGSRPAAIVLTHGHFDHVGALPALADRWDVPVYAHPLEFPYLDGRSPYPPPDPTVGGGAMSALSPLYPRGPFDLGDRLSALPDDGSVPGMPGWQWIHTPGHTPGHVALFRPEDRLLVAGDAFVTTKQESAIAALLQTPEMHGPPAYFTPDWASSRRSVEELASLEPSIAATGHGRPLYGETMRTALRALARDFDAVAVPRRGRYVGRPAIADERGVVSVPPPVPNPMSRVLVGVGATLLVGGAVRALAGRGKRGARHRARRPARHPARA